MPLHNPEIRPEGVEAATRAVARPAGASILSSVNEPAVALAEGDELTLVHGDPAWVVYYRSTSKPLQALVGVTSGAADAFGFTSEELALAAGSHSTLPRGTSQTRCGVSTRITRASVRASWPRSWVCQGTLAPGAKDAAWPITGVSVSS